MPVPALAGAMGAAGMALCLGWSIVGPTNFEWLMHGDYGLHFLGWHLFRRGPWAWPIGASPLHIWPIGSSIGLTDAIPLVGIPLKLVDGLLPPVFQFIGLWLVASVALQGVFGALLMRLATPRVSLQLLGAALLMLSPPLLYRINHAALTAHWVLLAGLWLNLRPQVDVFSWRQAAAWALLCAVTAAIQPYLLLMVAVLMLAAHARQAIVSPAAIIRSGISVALSLGASLLSLWQSGSLMVRGGDGLEIGGFGVWSANLLTLIMPTEAFTLFSPGLFPYAHKEQYEGYAYLGLGMLGLALVALFGLVVRGRRSTGRIELRHLPLTLGLLFLAAMAFGPRLTAGQQTLWSYDVSWWGPLTIFRTSGRMIWPVYYAIVIGILFAVTRMKPAAATAALTCALVVQAIDLSGTTRYLQDVRAFGYRDPLTSPFWSAVPRHYQRLVLIPTNLCAGEGFLDFHPFGLLAGTERVAINSGITARYDVRRTRAYCDELGREIRSGLQADDSLYVIRPDLVDAVLGYAAATELTCTVVDAFGVCFSAQSHTRWRDTFDLPRSRLPANAELMRFHRALDQVYREVLGRGEQPMPSTPAERVEAVARYLAYRMEGCPDGAAERRASAPLVGDSEPGLCAGVARQQRLPPANEAHAFSTRLDTVLRQRRPTAAAGTHVDLEGEAVWTQAYVRERIAGASEATSRKTVLDSVRAAAR